MALKKMHWSVLALNLAWFGASPSAWADSSSTTENKPEPKAEKQVRQSGFEYTNQLIFRRNPVGLANQIALGYRQNLGDRSPDDVLYGNAHVYSGIQLRLNTLVNTTEAFVSYEPIALLQVKASVGWLSSVVDGSTQNIYDQTVFNQTTKALTAISGASVSDGAAASFQAQLRFKRGPLVIRNTTLFKQYFGMNEDLGKGYFFEPFLDVAMKANSAVTQNDLDLIAMPESTPLSLGLRHTYIQPFETVDEISDSDIHRLGLFLLWKFANKPHQKHFRDQYVVLLTQWHLKHPLRAAESTFEGEFDPTADPLQYTRSRWEPYGVLSWGFGGQFSKQ